MSTPRVSVAVMAHPTRARFIPELVAKLDREATVVWDQHNDRWDTGRRAWQAIDRTATHGLVLQDDAVICRDLVAGVEQALEHVPEKTPLCLYAGRVRPYRTLITQLVNQARDETSWLTMASLNWGPGIVLPTAFIDDMIAWGDGRPNIANYDRRISRWLWHQNIRTWYPWPSLVDHRDSPSLIPGRTAKRHAHRFIGADASALTQRWDGRIVTLPELDVDDPTPSRIGGAVMVKFVSEKYPDLAIPTIGVRFRDGEATVTTRGAIAYLRSPAMRRRGVRLAEEATPPASAEAPKPASDKQPPAESSADEVPQPDGAPDSEPDPQPSDPNPDEVPDGTAAEILEWVGDNPDRAHAATLAEQARPQPRTSLLTKLSKLTAAVDIAPATVRHDTTAEEV